MQQREIERPKPVPGLAPVPAVSPVVLVLGIALLVLAVWAVVWIPLGG